MDFMQSLAFEIAANQTELENLEKRRKEIKKRLRALSALLEECNNQTTSEESHGKDC